MSHTVAVHSSVVERRVVGLLAGLFIRAASPVKVEKPETMADDSVDEGLEGPTAEQDLSCDCAALVDLHEECCTLQYIIDSGYWVLPGDRVALTRPAMYSSMNRATRASPETVGAVVGVRYDESVRGKDKWLYDVALDCGTVTSRDETRLVPQSALGGQGGGRRRDNKSRLL